MPSTGRGGTSNIATLTVDIKRTDRIQQQQSTVSTSQKPYLEHCLEDGDEHAGSALAQLLERVDGLRINANAVQERVDACLHKTKTPKEALKETANAGRLRYFRAKKLSP